MAIRQEIEDTPQNYEGLAKMARKLGYKDSQYFGQGNGFVIGDLLEFFDDNPGACEAVVEWVLEHDHDMNGERLEDDEEE